MANEERVSIYREQGNDPDGVTVGGYRLGRVHHGVPRSEAEHLEKHKKFRIVPRDFNPASEERRARAQRDVGKKDAATTEDTSSPAADQSAKA